MAAETRTAGAADVLRADGLAKRYGDRDAVADLTLAVGTGRAFGLLGPNGAGKTTSVRLLTGLLPASAGRVELFGETLGPGNASRLRARVGVQTDTELYATLSARENLRIWGDLFDVDRRRLPGRIDEVLEMLGLASRADSLVGEFSKGMRQKLAVARAVLHEPELLFLDEPTADLDPEAAADLVDYLRSLIRAGGTTVVLCTHQLHGLEALCDDLGILVDGRLVATGPVDDLLAARWPTPGFRLEVGGDPAAAARTIAAAGGAPVLESDGALTVALPTEDRVPALVAALVAAGVPVHAVVPLRPTITDYYFATVDDAAARREEARA
ncbi:ABC transporter ATP-binding protein [Agromyces seonyuensis]|uniref:ATP-binding cassette domain-containing protein n=1 Tax=Agromyces seonyuensis TaxID=2662446 RepID=A0A6I4P1A8_9MICO|nr:ABC transporter ATP-binding protein [Agromyces seonyuensis]MWB97007.1 ATP-binding cassette domain-containing protein [Agromyces seonyuensis]